MNKDIAIIGISGRFPEASTIDELYNNLKNGKDSVRELSKKRIKDTSLDPNKKLREIGFLEDIDKFDHKYFGISMAEAQMMDPNHRILLEVTHETIENAGYCIEELSGSRTAVFVADIYPEYHKLAEEFLDTMISGNSPAFLATRIARMYNFTGNALMVDTACSSSLVAVHLACNEIYCGDAESALVCGVNINLLPYTEKKWNSISGLRIINQERSQQKRLECHVGRQLFVYY
ncbi:polyketide synthase [Paenibacillus gorillae]|uniref:beta-ketoacyl [acyl carrier protein] synthase domain-containing protein n=1 Tax=Paenibacillus gorillae TaxID=1243662 RepID=UPI0004B3592B|nr:polyketide synthase [Paenibacillus gorillae]